MKPSFEEEDPYATALECLLGAQDLERFYLTGNDRQDEEDRDVRDQQYRITGTRIA